MVEYIGFTLINLVILALNLKLYTEYFKDKSQANRKAGHENAQESTQSGTTLDGIRERRREGQTRLYAVLPYGRQRDV